MRRTKEDFHAVIKSVFDLKSSCFIRLTLPFNLYPTVQELTTSFSFFLNHLNILSKKQINLTRSSDFVL